MKGEGMKGEGKGEGEGMKAVVELERVMEGVVKLGEWRREMSSRYYRNRKAYGADRTPAWKLAALEENRREAAMEKRVKAFVEPLDG
ncbi:hypothetical protein LTR28_002219 [Elasticomyces elasticus]|nr:hypothetical protein LTR28_002219 [Elasticomyces elasticus]